jgi:hypothetical protein
MAIGVILSLACPQTGGVNAQAAASAAAPNAPNRAETSIEPIVMAV